MNPILFWLLININNDIPNFDYRPFKIRTKFIIVFIILVLIQAGILLLPLFIEIDMILYLIIFCFSPLIYLPLCFIKMFEDD